MKGGVIVTGFGFVATIILAPVAVMAGVGAGWGVLSLVPAGPSGAVFIEGENVGTATPIVDEPTPAAVEEEVPEAVEPEVVVPAEPAPAAEPVVDKPKPRRTPPRTRSTTKRRRAAPPPPPPEPEPLPAPEIENPDFDDDEEMNIDDALEGFEIEMLDEEEDTKKKKKKKK